MMRPKGAGLYVRQGTMVGRFRVVTWLDWLLLPLALTLDTVHAGRDAPRAEEPTRRPGKKPGKRRRLVEP